MNYTEIVEFVTFNINEGTPENIADIITPEHIAVVQACGIVTNPNTAVPTNLVTPIDVQIDVLLTDLANAASVGDVLAMFNSTNAAAADLYAEQTDRVAEHEGEISSDADVADVLADTDETTIIKTDSQC